MVFLSGTLDRLDGTVAGSGTYRTQGGKYFDADNHTLSKPWFNKVYSDYDIQSELYRDIVVTVRADEAATVTVEQTEAGTAAINTPEHSTQITVAANKNNEIEQRIYLKNFRVKYENPSTAAANVVQTVRLEAL